MPNARPTPGLRLTPEKYEQLRGLAEAVEHGTARFITYEADLAARAFREIERLRREREMLVEALTPAVEALADLDKGYYRVAKQDPGGYVMGSVAVSSLVTAIESTRKALALLDGERGEE